MKKVKFLVVSVALVLALLWSEARSSTSKGDNTTPIIRETILKHLPSKDNRPNAPSRYYIACFYGESFIEFVFPNGVQTIEVRIYNEIYEYNGTATADTPWIELPSLSGIYDIECTTDDGRVFSGSVEW